ILGRRLAFGQSLLHDHVDGAAVFGVHADHRAGAAGHAQGFEDAAVIEHENAGIRHEELETGDAVADELFHFLKARIGKIGDDAMEAVVGDSFRGCLLHPCVECGAQRLAFVLDREVDESGGTAECGCAGAGLEIIRARSAAERHVQVCVDVNPAGEDVFAGHIEDTPGVFARQAAADGDDLAVLNGKVGLVSICGSGHGPVGNDSVESHSRPLWCWDRGRSVLESRHYLYQFRSGRERRMNFGITIKPDLEVERILSLTEQAERAGFKYGWIFDSHVLWKEPYPLLTLMASRTRKMKLGTCVTNTAVRDLTVTASLFATLHLISGGLMV